MAGPESRRELVLRILLDAICDGPGNLTQSILNSVARYTRDCGMVIEKLEVVDGLKELVELGWAGAWKFHASSKPPDPWRGFPSLDEMENPAGAWFCITDAGMKVHMTEYDGWPFDGDGNVLKDWVPPAA